MLSTLSACLTLASPTATSFHDNLEQEADLISFFKSPLSHFAGQAKFISTANDELRQGRVCVPYGFNDLSVELDAPQIHIFAFV